MTFLVVDGTARYSFNYGRVEFDVQSGTDVIPCAILEGALMDRFKAYSIASVDLVATFEVNAARIAAVAERKYFKHGRDSQGMVIVGVLDH